MLPVSLDKPSTTVRPHATQTPSNVGFLHPLIVRGTGTVLCVRNKTPPGRAPGGYSCWSCQVGIPKAPGDGSRVELNQGGPFPAACLAAVADGRPSRSVERACSPGSRQEPTDSGVMPAKSKQWCVPFAHALGSGAERPRGPPMLSRHWTGGRERRYGHAACCGLGPHQHLPEPSR